MVVFEESKTRINLMRAFAGESQARNRYTFAAEQAREQGLNVVGEVFDFTAAQEKTHAEVFYRLLTPLNGLNILMDAGFPVNTGKTAAEQLRMAAHNEMEESRVVYPDFARTAQEEGFAAIGDTFERIAAIEASHAERFTRMADALETGKLFAQDGETIWMCRSCGYLHCGKEAPKVCPVCSRGQGFVIRENFEPFTPRK